MQTLFHENPYRQQIANGHSCMVRVHTKPEYQMMTPDRIFRRTQQCSRLLQLTMERSTTRRARRGGGQRRQATRVCWWTKRGKRAENHDWDAWLVLAMMAGQKMSPSMHTGTLPICMVIQSQKIAHGDSLFVYYGISFIRWLTHISILWKDLKCVVVVRRRRRLSSSSVVVVCRPSSSVRTYWVPT